MKRFRPGTAVLVVLILVLGYFLALGQRREARLRAALALYEGRANGAIARYMDHGVGMDWPKGTPLNKAIEKIKFSPHMLSLDFANGLPILVDPDGLREAGQSLSSPVAARQRTRPGIRRSLGQQLRIILEPLGLAAEVKDGAIVITSRGRVEERPAAAEERSTMSVSSPRRAPGQAPGRDSSGRFV